MRQQQLIVLKFGGSVLRHEDDIHAAVHEVYRWVRGGHRVVAVVSAFEGTTDSLLGKAKGVAHDAEPDEHATALLLATGEFQSASLLTLALARAGVPSRVLAPQAAGLRVRRARLDSDPESLDSRAILAALADAPVAVVPGFVGVDADGQFTLLGRGGSDLTAVFLAAELGARCRLIKDVDGLYERDPALGGPPARRFARISWEHAANLGGGIVQAKALRTAAEREQEVEIAAAGRDDCTRVGLFEPTFHRAHAGVPPLRIALLGAGTVGGGVFAHLRRLPREFTVSSIVVRDVRLAAARGLDPELLRTDLVSASENACDVVVEQLGGVEPAAGAIRAALRSGKHVVTANKSVVAVHGEEFAALATAAGVRFVYSAAVGGAVPMLEAVDRFAGEEPIVRLEGVLNGTSNFVLNEVAAGSSFDRALKRAQAAGYAEANPSRDLSGEDAADKLTILTRHAFLGTHGPPCIEREPISPSATGSASSGSRPRHAAYAARDPDGAAVRAGVVVRDVGATDPLFDVPGAGNRLVITGASGRREIVSGAGAGRWPTSESVIADLWDLRRDALAATREERVGCGRWGGRACELVVAE